MLEDVRLILTLDLPRFLMERYFSGMEVFYCKWACAWIEYGDCDWVEEVRKTHWDDCDDSPSDVSRHRYAEEILLGESADLEEHFNDISSQITYHKLPSVVNIKPTEMKGVVLWSMT